MRRRMMQKFNPIVIKALLSLFILAGLSVWAYEFGIKNKEGAGIFFAIFLICFNVVVIVFSLLVVFYKLMKWAKMTNFFSILIMVSELSLIVLYTTMLEKESPFVIYIAAIITAILFVLQCIMLYKEQKLLSIVDNKDVQDSAS
jgi:glycerol-3-phosphate acyltransferase PlsY